MRLDDVDWDRALAGAAVARAGAGAARLRADALSLSALFAADLAAGTARLAAAREADPFNPLHAVREALLYMRFGRWDPAADTCQALVEAAPGSALPPYLRGLAMLRQEEPRRAANLAQDATNANPKFGLAAFLKVEASLRTQVKGVEKLLRALPRGPEYAAAWADLLVKMALSRSEERVKVAARCLTDPTALSPKSKQWALAAAVLKLVAPAAAAKPAAKAAVPPTADAASAVVPAAAEPVAKGAAPPADDALERRLMGTRPGSRAEQVALLLIHDHLQAASVAPGGDDLGWLRRLHERCPDRPAVRRLYVALLTRRAMAEAAAEHYPEALRLVERCLRLEPQETVHYQNRAALFTMMREARPYHDAWFELNRHEYRLALLGRSLPDDARRLAKPHRLFAQQARLSPQGARGGPAPGRRADVGLFSSQSRIDEDGDRANDQKVNQAKVEADPDLLRQWVHHQQAELAFSHWALGPDPRRFLLHPDNRRTARARAGGLGSLTESLAVLVPEEGRMLADRMSRRWAALAEGVTPAYTAPPDDPDVQRLQRQHLSVLGDLALLCLGWQPDGRRPDMVEEVVGMLDSVAPFFDEQVLYAAVADNSTETPAGVRLLYSLVRDVTGSEGNPKRPLTDEQRKRIVRRLSAELLDTMAFRTYDHYRERPDGAQRALAFSERARELDPDGARLQLATARFLLLAGYYDECRLALAKVQRAPRGRDPKLLGEADEIRKILEERAKEEGGGRRREDDFSAAAPAGTQDERLADLEAEVERFPASIQAYEDLAHRHAAAGRFADALDWSDRAIGQCLGRDAQVSARSLNLEVLGLEALARRDLNAVRLYLTGAHRPALEVIETAAAEQRPYPLTYLLGNCLLGLGRPEEARETYQSALERCDRQLHRAVLRRLASDIDQAYLLVARRAVQERLDDAAWQAALGETAAMIAQLRRPEAGLIDLARVHLEAATAAAGSGREPLPRPADLRVPGWEADLDQAYAGTDLERAERLARLSARADPSSARAAELLLQKVEAVRKQLALADALARSAELLRGDRADEALRVLDATGAAALAEPRVVRQRALLLLKLGRFDEAEEAVERLRASTSAVAREFVAAYPALAFRQRVGTACRLIRAGAGDEAMGILTEAKAGALEEALELGYCRAFCRTMQGYRLRRQGKPADATRSLHQAMREVEAHLPAARAAGHARLLELYETLDKDLEAEA